MVARNFGAGEDWSFKGASQLYSGTHKHGTLVSLFIATFAIRCNFLALLGSRNAPRKIKILTENKITEINGDTFLFVLS